jgi:non-haem Fe2+, alpha-ketoglutarate-dependent halogenase
VPKLLSDDQIAHYHREGYLYGIPALTQDEVRACRASLEAYEARVGQPLDFPEKSKSYLLFDWADRLVHHPRVLDAVEDLIGPNILVYHTTMWTKEARTPAFVHWHQDGAYFFLDPPLHVTAWVALSDCPPEAGCVRVLPGSHLLGELAHQDDPGPYNMIKRGQGILDRFKPDDGVLMPLRAGEISLHHTRLVHSSGPNNAPYRRMGLGISYIPTSVRDRGEPRATALLVRGDDPERHFLAESRLAEPLSAAARLAHQAAVERFRARQDAGARLQPTG